MKQRILFLLACGMSAGQFTQAQTATSVATSEQTAFAMTRATVEFLAKDAKKFGYNKTPCQPCATYSDLNQFVKQNHLLGADGLITDIQKQSATLPPSALQAFLLERVSKGSRSYRQKLPSFPSYQHKLVALAKGQSGIPDSDGPTLNDQSAAVDNDSMVTKESESTQPAETGQSESVANSQTQFTMLSLMPLVLSMLSLVGVAFLLFRRSQDRPSAKEMSSDVLNEMSKRISKLEKDNASLSNQVTLLDKAIRQQSGAATLTQNQPRSAQPIPTPQPIPSTNPPTTASPTQLSKSDTIIPATAAASPLANTLRASHPAEPTLFYGRTADLGDGFSVSGLSTKPDRDTVFEIRRVDNGRAEFQVSDNPDLQRLALSDPYSYLNDTCAYATQPRPGSRIQTERPGTLSLQGEKWAITEKAQVSFQ